jgi:hypothetical protein
VFKKIVCNQFFFFSFLNFDGLLKNFFGNFLAALFFIFLGVSKLLVGVGRALSTRSNRLESKNSS